MSVEAALAEPSSPVKEQPDPTLGRRFAELTRRIRAPRSKPVTLAAMLIALSVGLASTATLGIVFGFVSFLATAAGVLLLNASVNVRHQQLQDDSAEIIASLHRASGNSQPIGNGEN